MLSEINDNLTVRYVPETDYLQVVNTSNSWINCLRMGLLDQYIFNNGNEYESGGFSLYNGGGTVTNNGSFLIFDGIKSTTGMFSCVNSYDLTHYNTLRVTYTCTLQGSDNYFRFGITGIRGSSSFTAGKELHFETIASPTIVDIDISNISFGYFTVYMRSGGYVSYGSILCVQLL